MLFSNCILSVKIKKMNHWSIRCIYSLNMLFFFRLEKVDLPYRKIFLLIPCYNSFYYLARIKQSNTKSEVLQRFTIKKLSEITSMQFNYISYFSLAPYIVVWSTVKTRKMRYLFGWRAINYEGAHCKVYYIWKLSSNLTCFIQKGDNLSSAASNFK